MINKREIIVFLSGPYTGETLEETENNIKRAELMAVKLWGAGYTVICPHLNTANFENICKCKYEDYIEGDLNILEKCDAVFMLRNWRKSNGSRIEHMRAQGLKKPIFKTIEDLDGWYEYKSAEACSCGL